MIEVEGFTKHYGDFCAVNNLSFAVQPGQILGLVGRNGAGKTTTIKALAGITKPSQGQLRLDHHCLSTTPLAAKRILGYIPDDPVLFDDLTIWEHLLFTASLYKVEDFEQTANQLLTDFDLQAKQHSPAQGLSRGMRQKVSVACAYLHDPKVLLFDEPMTGLDPQGIKTLEASIKARAQDGAAIIVSSHMLNLVENLCSHLMVLHEGERRWFGSMDDLNQTTGAATKAQLEQLFFSLTNAQ